MLRSLQAAIFVLPLLLPSSISAINLDCKNVLVKGVRWNLEPLQGPHVLFQVDENTGTDNTRNTSFGIDLCKPLDKKWAYNDKACPSGTRVCAQLRYYDDSTEGEPKPAEAWPIAGEILHNGGKMEPSLERLKGSSSNADTKSEGVRITLHGGSWDSGNKKKVPQKLIATMLCDHDRTGLEGEEKEEKRRRDEDDDEDDDNNDPGDGQHESQGPNKSMKLISYGEEDTDGYGVLRIEWRTKYACEDQVEKEEPEKGDRIKSHWGFFTWFIIVAFLGIAAYLVFGSWLNYSRHGARGWDLVPHGDTLRDLPYLMKDWGRRVVSTVQGGGSRGGYSAI